MSIPFCSAARTRDVSSRHSRRKRISGRFAYQPVKVLSHVAVTTLSHASFRVLVLMSAQYSGYNNGALGLSKNQAERQNISNKTLYKALATLVERGLVERTYPASRVPQRPTMYALTWRPINDTEWSSATRVPTHAYQDWSPPSKQKLSDIKIAEHSVG